MSNSEYQRLANLFSEACAVPLDQRRRFVDSRCEGNEALRHELLMMLEEDQSDDLQVVSARESQSTDGPNPPRLEGYEVQELLGEGGMGVVWRAVHLHTQRAVALKVVSNLRISSPRIRARFNREVELCAKLSHPNIARIYDSGEHDGCVYYSMELIDDLSIDKYLRDKQFTPRQIVTLMLPVCKALAYAHRQGVLHRDVKPSNILVDRQQRPVLVDFGLAKAISDSSEVTHLTLSGDIFGTPAYMAPEQAKGLSESVDARSDVYSLGAILYEFAVGRPPHDQSGSSHQIMQRIVFEEILRPRVCNPTVDRDLEAILLKSLAKSPKERYSSAGELAADLERYLNQDIVLAQTPSFTYLAAKWLSRYKGLAATSLLLLLLALGATAAFVWITIQHEREARRLSELAVRRQESAEVALAHSERLSYVLQLQIARDQTADYRYRQAWRFLRSFPVSSRGWEWNYLAHMVQPNPPPFVQSEPFDVPVRRIKFSPDGRTLAVALGGSTIEVVDKADIVLIDVATGKERRRLSGHTDSVFAIAFSPDGSQLLSGGKDRTLRRWQVSSGELLEQYEPSLEFEGGPVGPFLFDLIINDQQVAFSAYPAGLFLAEIDKNFSWQSIYDSATNLVSLEGERGHLAFSEDGKRLAWATLTWQESMGYLFAIDTDTKQVLAKHQQPPGKPFEDVCFSPLDNRIVTSGFDGSIQFWDTDDLQPLREITGPRGSVHSTCFLGDGRRFFTIAHDELVRTWDLVSGRTLSAIYPSENASGRKLAISPVQQTLATVHAPGNRVSFWPIPQDIVPEELLTRHAAKVRFSAVSPTRPHVVSVSEDGIVRLSDLNTQQTLWENSQGRPYATAACFSPDGNQVAIGRSRNPDSTEPPWGELRILDVRSGEEISEPIEISKWVWDLEWDSKDNHLFVATGIPGDATQAREAEVQIIDLNSRRVIRQVRTLGRRCRAVELLPGGKTFATASELEVAVWDRSTGELLASDVQKTGRNFVKWIDGKLVTGNEGSIEFRDPVSLELIETWRQTQQQSERFGFAQIADISLSPDGRRIVSASWNGTLTIWEAKTGDALLTFAAHQGGIHHVDFSPDGSTIVSSSHDGTVHAWRAQSSSDTAVTTLPMR